MPKIHTGKRTSPKTGWVPPEQIQDERFGGLLVWLMFILFLCIVDLVGKIVNYKDLMQILVAMSNLMTVIGAKGHTMQPWELPLSMLLNSLRILFAISLLYRQKWGLYGIVGVHAVSFILELLLGYFSISSITRLVIVPGVTCLLARPVWKYLE